jgi:hypothetical protein
VVDLQIRRQACCRMGRAKAENGMAKYCSSRPTPQTRPSSGEQEGLERSIDVTSPSLARESVLRHAVCNGGTCLPLAGRGQTMARRGIAQMRMEPDPPLRSPSMVWPPLWSLLLHRPLRMFSATAHSTLPRLRGPSASRYGWWVQIPAQRPTGAVSTGQTLGGKAGPSFMQSPCVGAAGC